MGFFDEWKGGTTTFGHIMAYFMLVIFSLLCIGWLIAFFIILAIYNPKSDDDDKLSKAPLLGIVGGTSVIFIIFAIILYFLKDNKTFDLGVGAYDEASLLGGALMG